jgi:hypothetical protein
LDFFCSSNEEKSILKYLLHSGDVIGLTSRLRGSPDLPPIDWTAVPAWPEPFSCFLWLRSAGSMNWHRSRPEAKGKTHGELVNRLLASMAWEANPPRGDEGMLDVETSPVMIYRRSMVLEGRSGPCLLICPASNPERISKGFAAWKRRCFAWVRRHGTRVHDWRVPSSTLPNPDGLLNSVYAFPEALIRLKRGDHEYAILLQD